MSRRKGNYFIYFPYWDFSFPKSRWAPQFSDEKLFQILSHSHFHNNFQQQNPNLSRKQASRYFNIGTPPKQKPKNPKTQKKKKKKKRTKSFQVDCHSQTESPTISFLQAYKIRVSLNSSSNQHRSSIPHTFPCRKLEKRLPHSLKPQLASNFKLFFRLQKCPSFQQPWLQNLGGKSAKIQICSKITALQFIYSENIIIDISYYFFIFSFSDPAAQN